jgi:hypothetical protein
MEQDKNVFSIKLHHKMTLPYTKFHKWKENISSWFI